MTRYLHAWGSHGLIGRFDELSDGSVSFSYSPAYSGAPISLSLPREGGWLPSAPAAFLDGLLPEDGDTRLRQQLAFDAASTSSFDLLESADAAGGLIFTREDEPPAGPVSVIPADDASIAVRIAQIEDAPRGSWWANDARRTRFSLAGAQGKFALTDMAGEWFWPTGGLPSTHIVKPGMPMAKGSVVLEHAGMSLVRAAGVPTAECSFLTIGGRTAYMVSRFDRTRDVDGFPVRLRAEDLCQALGRPARDKYDIDIPDVIALLRRVDPSDGLCYDFFEQMAASIYAGNRDAHAKNYSLLLEGELPDLAPMYDIVPTVYWAGFDDDLAMPFGMAFDDGGVFYARDLTPAVWAAEGDSVGLDGERVADIARRVAGSILAAAPDLLAGVPDRDRLLARLADDASSVEPIYPDSDPTRGIDRAPEPTRSSRSRDRSR